MSLFQCLTIDNWFLEKQFHDLLFSFFLQWISNWADNDDDHVIKPSKKLLTLLPNSQCVSRCWTQIERCNQNLKEEDFDYLSHSIFLRCLMLSTNPTFLKPFPHFFFVDIIPNLFHIPSNLQMPVVSSTPQAFFGLHLTSRPLTTTTKEQISKKRKDRAFPSSPSY